MNNSAIPKDRLAVSVSEAAKMTTLSRGTIRSLREAEGLRRSRSADERWFQSQHLRV